MAQDHEDKALIWHKKPEAGLKNKSNSGERKKEKDPMQKEELYKNREM